MTISKLIQALNRLKVETGSLACMGCGHEHNCSTNGCAIIREAMEQLKLQLAVFNEREILKLRSRPWEWNPDTCAFWQKTHAREPKERETAIGASPRIHESATA